MIIPHLSYSAISAAGNFCFYPDFKGIQPFDPFVTGLQNLTIDPSNEAVVPHLSQNDYDSRLTLPDTWGRFTTVVINLNSPVSWAGMVTMQQNNFRESQDCF